MSVERVGIPIIARPLAHTLLAYVSNTPRVADESPRRNDEFRETPTKIQELV
jgi:hypothetical protein